MKQTHKEEKTHLRHDANNKTMCQFPELPTCSNNTILDLYSMGCTDVDSISIGANSRWCHYKIESHNPETISECYVHLLTTDHLKILDFQILALVESNGLQHDCYTRLECLKRERKTLFLRKK
jgi:hypothetical protein